MTVYRLGEYVPHIPASAYVAPEATVIGRVLLGEHASVWPGVSIRADNEPIRIGARCNVQEGAVLHVDPGYPMDIGDGASIGHQAMLHGCTIGEESLVGIQAVIMNGASIGRRCLVGAGALVTERKIFPDGSLILGSPAKLVRTLTDEEIATLAANAEGYVRRQQYYKAELERID